MSCPWRPIEATALYVRDNADGSRLTAVEGWEPDMRWLVFLRVNGREWSARGPDREELAARLMDEYVKRK